MRLKWDIEDEKHGWMELEYSSSKANQLCAKAGQ